VKQQYQYVLNHKAMFMRVTKPKGFTLVELVIGIVVFSIALGLFTSLIVPQAIKSVDPVFQVRAAELGQSLINEIASKSFDETSDRTGGSTLCDAACIGIVLLDADTGESRANYDDVDDYNGFVLPDSSGMFTNSLGNNMTLDGNSLYAGFSANVTVVYDADMNGVADTNSGGDLIVSNTKLITVTVTTPNGEDIVFSTFRSNY
jgi:MSHA pilin protein MshD